MLTIYGIPNCDTVKRARAWLAEHGQNAQFHDFKKQGVPEAALDGWIAALGWERLVNRKGTTWRQLDEATTRWAIDIEFARVGMRVMTAFTVALLLVVWLLSRRDAQHKARAIMELLALFGTSPDDAIGDGYVELATGGPRPQR